MPETASEWKVTYRALDNAALLALLPILRHESSRVLGELKHVEGSTASNKESDAHIAELFNEALTAFDSRLSGDEEDRAEFQRIRTKMRGELDAFYQSTQGHRDSTAEFVRRLSEHLWDHQQREQWVREELIRRDLLPAFPSAR